LSEPHATHGASAAKWLAVAECAAVTAVYVLIAFGGLRLIDVSSALDWLAPEEAQVVSGFIAGAISQIVAVALIWLLFRPVDLARSFAAIRTPSRAEGWFIALTIIGVETVVMYSFILDTGWRAIEPSAINLSGSIAPLLDGVTQEVFFRGYLIFRLSRGGHGLFAQVLVSSLAFSVIHIGYVGQSWGDALPPLLGTLGLGVGLGWAMIRGGHSLKAPILAHAAILVIVQPWLALAR